MIRRVRKARRLPFHEQVMQDLHRQHREQHPLQLHQAEVAIHIRGLAQGAQIVMELLHRRGREQAAAPKASGPGYGSSSA